VPGKAPQAVICLAPVVGLMVSGLIPNVQAALIGCMLMGALGCIDITSAFGRLEVHCPHCWNVAVFSRPGENRRG
jgi:hypothetical protein